MIFIVISSPGWMTVQETWKNHLNDYLEASGANRPSIGGE